jgi:uncharacterized phage protein (TIGR02218 family)
VPRDISTELRDHLSGEVLTLALCVKLTRLDGSTMGFTSWDRSLTFEGVSYEPESAVQSTAVRASEGAGADNFEIVSLIQSDRVTALDLRAGIYNGAEVEAFLVNWADLTMGSLILVAGSVGEITFSEGTFKAEVRSLLQRLQQAIGSLVSKGCQVRRLGDTQCQVDLSTFTFQRTVQSAVGKTITFAADAHATGFFDYGEVEMRSGLNKGHAREVKTHTLSAGTAVIDLQEAFPFTVAVGDIAVLTKGCNRTFEMCVSDFDNAVNYRGFPDTPGRDQIMRRGRR